MKFYSLSIVFVLFVFLACTKGISDGEVATTTADSSLKQLPFPFGAAISAELLRTDPRYKALIIREFKSISTENAMKFGIIHPLENTYNWTDGDEIVAFAQANCIRVHGHTLNWYQDAPDWLKNFDGDKNAWENLLKTHIQTIVKHYKGKVTSWDVVNEAFEDDGRYRNSIWVQKLGTDYIARAFQYAHEADPVALLFYNDYGQEYGYEYKGLKRNAILALVNELKSRGVPINGIGLQMHTKYTQSDFDISLAISTAAETGLKVHISELDVALNPNFDATLTFSPSLDEMQASKYKAIVKLYNAIPKAQQFGITTWNVTDKDSWVPVFFKRPDWPLPFNADYHRKAAYRGIFDGLK
ncbi:endo-1,4-beta-xylanase [Pedobacter frigidisoli]|uniref:Beta-xylanase n=1 Tax=Pedobacter frigidisoli TaxID=2530455 RepID=A0A4R0NM98_9SPHI|nr:endo-1,4-beta-xylanase [Pedobacter frigidisoli]TCD01982.1 endo-1,4-beta-xylanase [Pedobacter frigidisoli]